MNLLSRSLLMRVNQPLVRRDNITPETYAHVRRSSSGLSQLSVGVEKLLPAKLAKIRSRQDALQTILSGRRDIFYTLILAVWDEERVFQQPQGVYTNYASRPAPGGGSECNRDFSPTTLSRFQCPPGCRSS